MKAWMKWKRKMKKCCLRWRVEKEREREEICIERKEARIYKGSKKATKRARMLDMWDWEHREREKERKREREREEKTI